MKRAVLYARVSSDDRQEEDRNLLGQLDMCRRYAQSRDYQVVAELHEDDRGASGAAFDLPQLNHIRDLACSEAFDVLIVRELDRLSRSLAKQLFVENELQRHGVEIEYVLDKYSDTPEGNLVKHVKASIAEFERLKIGERVMQGRELQVKSGNVLVGIPPFGYRLVNRANQWTLEINAAEAQIVRQISAGIPRVMRMAFLLARIVSTSSLHADKVPTPADLRGAPYTKKRGQEIGIGSPSSGYWKTRPMLAPGIGGKPPRAMVNVSWRQESNGWQFRCRQLSVRRHGRPL